MALSRKGEKKARFVCGFNMLGYLGLPDQTLRHCDWLHKAMLVD